MAEWFIIATAAGLIALWWDGNASHSLAQHHGRSACTRCGLQFLDETVALAHMRLRRDRDGRMRWLRRYAFEFTSDGAGRYRGHVELLGKRLREVYLEPYPQRCPDDQQRQPIDIIQTRGPHETPHP